jgi:hypothetical protein
MGVLFFLIVVTLVPFAIGPDSALLRRIGPAILWLGALLASLLTLDQLFADDREDGSLDLILMGSAPLQLAIIAKAAAHWLTAGLPLVIAAPLLGVFFNIDLSSMAAVALTLLAGTPRADFPRTDRRGARGDAAPGRTAGAGVDPAADDSGSDFRRGRIERGDRRPVPFGTPFHHPLRAVAREPGDWTRWRQRRRCDTRIKIWLRHDDKERIARRSTRP